MLKSLLKPTILFMTLFLLIGCGEVVISDPTKPSTSEPSVVHFFTIKKT